MPVSMPDRIRTAIPEAATSLDELNERAWASVDPQLLELCRLRIAALLGDAPGLAYRTPAAAGLDEAKVAALSSWWTSDGFTPAERARLAFTEQFVTSVSSMSDSDVAPLLVDDDGPGVYQFASAIYVIDMTTRFQMMTRAVFDESKGDEVA